MLTSSLGLGSGKVWFHFLLPYQSRLCSIATDQNGAEIERPNQRRGWNDGWCKLSFLLLILSFSFCSFWFPWRQWVIHGASFEAVPVNVKLSSVFFFSFFLSFFLSSFPPPPNEGSSVWNGAMALVGIIVMEGTAHGQGIGGMFSRIAPARVGPTPHGRPWSDGPMTYVAGFFIPQRTTPSLFFVSNFVCVCVCVCVTFLILSPLFLVLLMMPFNNPSRQVAKLVSYRAMAFSGGAWFVIPSDISLFFFLFSAT